MEFFNFFKHWNDNREKSPTPQLKSVSTLSLNFI